MMLCWIAVNGVSSIIMTLANKRLASIFPHPSTVIFLQNIIVFLLGCFVLRSQRVPLSRFLSASNLKHVKWVGFATSLVLTTSIVALRYAPVPLIVTVRNLTPIFTSLLEKLVLGRRFSLLGYVGLLCGLCGSLLYTFFDLPQQGLNSANTGPEKESFFLRHEFGFLFVFANMILSSTVSILERTTMDSVQGLGPTEVNQLRILTMTPLLLGFSLSFEDLPKIRATLADDFLLSSNRDGFKSSILFYVLLTGVGAATFGISALSLTAMRISPTTLAFLNIMYKVGTTVIGSILFPTVVKWTSWVGYLLALGGFGIYMVDRNRDGSAERKKKF